MPILKLLKITWLRIRPKSQLTICAWPLSSAEPPSRQSRPTNQPSQSARQQNQKSRPKPKPKPNASDNNGSEKGKRKLTQKKTQKELKTRWGGVSESVKAHEKVPSQHLYSNN